MASSCHHTIFHCEKTVMSETVPKNVDQKWMDGWKHCLYLTLLMCYGADKQELIFTSHQSLYGIFLHRMFNSEVKNKVADTHPATIPNGMTSILQPADACLNKAFEERICKLHTIGWVKNRSWPLSIKRPRTLQIPQLSVATWHDNPDYTIVHAFKKCQFQMNPMAAEARLSARIRGRRRRWFSRNCPMNTMTSKNIFEKGWIFKSLRFKNKLCHTSWVVFSSFC